MGALPSKSEPSEAKSNFFTALESVQRDEEEYEYLSRITHFDVDTLRLLHVRFSAIDKSIDKDARISLEELAKCMNMNPKSIILCRLFKYMDRNQLGLTFRIFATTMSILTVQETHEQKLKLMFFLCDLNDDGFIDKQEVKRLLMDSLEHLQPLVFSEEIIDLVIESTFEYFDEDKVSFKEFCQFIDAGDNIRLLQYLTFDIKQLLKYEQDVRKKQLITQSSMNTRVLHHGPYQQVVKEEKKKHLKKQETLRLFDEVESVRTIHSADEITVSDDNK